MSFTRSSEIGARTTGTTTGTYGSRAGSVRDDDDDDDGDDDGGGGGAIEDAVRRLDRERGSVGGDDA